MNKPKETKWDRRGILPFAWISGIGFGLCVANYLAIGLILWGGATAIVCYKVMKDRLDDKEN